MGKNVMKIIQLIELGQALQFLSESQQITNQPKSMYAFIQLMHSTGTFTKIFNLNTIFGMQFNIIRKTFHFSI